MMSFFSFFWILAPMEHVSTPSRASFKKNMGSIETHCAKGQKSIGLSSLWIHFCISFECPVVSLAATMRTRRLVQAAAPVESFLHQENKH